MSKKKRKPVRRKPQGAENQVEHDEVRLKPFLGISPGVYLTILYSILLLFVLFLLLFVKGLRERGEYLSVTTFPPGASVRVDDLYSGSSPCEILIKQGPHTITVSKPHFAPIVMEDTFRGPVFGTLFVRPRRRLDLHLQVADSASLMRDALSDFSANPHIPEILVETAWAGIQSPLAHEDLYDFIDKSKYFVTNPLQMHALLYAFSYLESGLDVLTPAALLAAVNEIIQLQQEYENFPFWLAVVLQEQAAQRVVETPWFSDLIASYRTRYEQLRRNESTVGQSGRNAAVSVQGLRFIGIPGGELLQGSGQDGFATVQIPHPVSIPEFYATETEIPNRLYRTFIQENPDWDPANRSDLMSRGLVDEQYLSNWQADSNRSDSDQTEWEQLPVTNVSFFAAQAFCEWLTSKIPAGFPGYVIRLPFESEWEWAARGGLVGADYPAGRPSERDRFFGPDVEGPAPVGASPENGYGLQDTIGNVWEWCLDWYSPVKYLFSSLEAVNNDFDSSGLVPVGSEKVIRGGSWANEQELIKVSTRGSQPPEWCTPYLGFRVILSRYIP